MLENLDSSITAKKSGEGIKRNLLGHVLASVLAGIFAFVLAMWVYQLDFWQSYFFNDSLPLGGNCEVSLAVTDSEARPTAFDSTMKVAVPHFGQPLFKDVIPNGQVAHAVYECTGDISSVTNKGPGVVNVHMGWIFGDWVSISVNGTERAAHPGIDKSVVPLNGADLALSQVHMTVWARGATTTVGFLGKAPMVLAEGTRKNSKIFGIETALQQSRSLYNLLPVLTLSIILIFGWISGIRSRLMVTTLFYFFIMAAKHLVFFAEDVAPWSPLKTYPFGSAFGAGTFLAYAVFGMELMGLGRRWISRSMLLCVGVIVAELALFAIKSDLNAISMVVERVNYGLTLVANLTLLTFGVRKLRLGAEDRSRAKVNSIFMACTAAFIALAVVDTLLVRFGVPVRLVFKMDLVMPLFVGGVLLYTLALIERNLRVEREARVKMEGDLAVAAKLQGIIVPSESEGRTHSWTYGIESKPYGPLSGDWVKVHNGENKSLFILGDVVGKGPSAALTHSGIAAIWDIQIRLWDKGTASATDVLSAINGTMFGLFKGAMNTTFAAAEVDRSGTVCVASCGNYWLHLGKDKCRLIPPTSRALLGIKEDLSVTFAKVELAPGDWLVCFTDGVLEGHRPVKRFFTAIEGQIDQLTPAKIREQLLAAGAETVQPDDASFLILRYNQTVQAAA